MGVVLDSSVIIAAERRGHTVLQILEQVRAAQSGEIEVGVSVVSIAELVRGAYRAKTQEQQNRRLEFIEQLASDVLVNPVTLTIARLAGRIEGQQEAKGVTALHLGYNVATLNVRDFQRVPGLTVVQL